LRNGRILRQKEMREMEKTKNRCSQCGGVLRAEDRFCPGCGARTAGTRSDHCTYCGEEIPRGRFCLHCGHMLQVVCPVCHTELGKNEHFCSHCGQLIDITGPPPSAFDQESMEETYAGT